ncbi:MAG: GDSL-type esterase/lipase family protein [Gaiellaceae bacterium MAG52_C11]|nr:GDSL-type esterase/lipase family protein [Candidatus Gaiellasilicea maunaloa]
MRLPVHVYVLLSLLAAGCGRAEGGEIATVNREGEIVVAALGDSIHAGSPYWDPDPDLRTSYGDDLDEQSQWEYWAAKKDPRLRFRNCGVWGERTDEIAARFDACTAGADVLVVQGGINDIAQGRDVEPAAENLRTMVRRGRELGLSVAIANVLPWNRGWPHAEEPIDRLNELIEELAREEDVPVLPFYATLEHPDEPGRMRGEWTSDGDHPSVEGYRRLGELAFRLP